MCSALLVNYRRLLTFKIPVNVKEYPWVSIIRLTYCVHLIFTIVNRKFCLFNHIIKFITYLQFLNGTIIQPDERRGAEYDYLKKYALEWLKVQDTHDRDSFLAEHNRYLELLDGMYNKKMCFVKKTYK